MNREQAAVSDCPVPKGILLVIGGSEAKSESPEKEVQKNSDDTLEILKTFIKLTEKESPVVEVITSGSGEGAESFADYESVFRELGVSKIGHFHHNSREEVLNDNWRKRVEQADAIFFSGGDQLKLTSRYGGTDFLVRLKERYVSERLILGGTSAGAMALSTPMIYAGNKDVQQITGEIRITTGLEFLKDVCIDTHFVDRGRFVRMAQVIATNPTCIGIGIEEDTAIVVRNGLDTEVIGSGIVVVINGFDILDSNVTDFGPDQKIFIKDLTVKLLARGYKYRLPEKNPRHV